MAHRRQLSSSARHYTSHEKLRDSIIKFPSDRTFLCVILWQFYEHDNLRGNNALVAPRYDLHSNCGACKKIIFISPAAAGRRRRRGGGGHAHTCKWMPININEWSDLDKQSPPWKFRAIPLRLWNFVYQILPTVLAHSKTHCQSEMQLKTEQEMGGKRWSHKTYMGFSLCVVSNYVLIK